MIDLKQKKERSLNMGEQVIEFFCKTDNSNHNGLSLYYCGKESCERGHSFGPAIRQHYLLHYIISGKGEYVANGKTYQLEKGMIFLIKPGQTTIYSADKEEPWTYFWLGFEGERVADLLAQCGFCDNELVKKLEKPNDFEKWSGQLLDFLRKEEENEYSLMGYFYLCLSLLRNKPSNHNQDYARHYYEKAIEYIQVQYGYDIKISNIARAIGVDRSYLYKVFMKYGTLSPQQYLIQFRLEKAAELIRSSSYSLLEIALSCGFLDMSSFYKQFKKYFNMTPRQFKQQS